MNVSVSEIVVILLIALLVVKPEQMPNIAYQIGRFSRTVRRMIEKFKSDMNG
jgi:Sec-independent protein translocase protein TatA